jgi:DNA-binding IclR family transcriptional regulator
MKTSLPPALREFLVKADAAITEFKVPNLIRGLAVLELLKEYPDGLGITEIGQKLKLPKNSAFRIAQTLDALGYLNRDDISKKYTLSKRLLILGAAATGDASLIDKAWDVMTGLRDFTGETVLIGTLAEDRGVVLEQALSTHAFKFAIDPGTTFDIHASAPGKAMLAHLPEPELEAILKRLPFNRINEHTITDRSLFRQELAWIRQNGYAVDRAEAIDGCHCVSAAILDRRGRAIAAIWATGPSNRLTADRFDTIGQRFAEAVRTISARLKA